MFEEDLSYTSLCKCVFNPHNVDIMLSACIVRVYYRVSNYLQF